MSLVLEQYGIILKRIEKKDIELIRKWRNHRDIRSFMGYQKIITKKQQELWFNRIDNVLNYYYLISFKGEKIGVINCKDVDLKNEIGEGGIFIWDAKYRSSPIPVFASLILLDFIFNEIKMGNLSFIQILKNNKNAIAYNKLLGYVKVPHQKDTKNQVYVLSKETYNKKAKKLRIAAKNFTETDGFLNVTGAVSNKNVEKLNYYLSKTV